MGAILAGAEECPSHQFRQTPDANECFSRTIQWMLIPIDRCALVVLRHKPVYNSLAF